MPTVETINPPRGMVVRFVSDLHYGHERCEAPAPAELAAGLLDGIGIIRKGNIDRNGGIPGH